MLKRFLIIFVGLFLLTTIVSCEDSSSQCKGDQNYQINTIKVKWFINGKTDSGGSFDTCYDVDAVYSHIVITGPDEFILEGGNVLCNSMEWITYDDSCNKFPIGNYHLDFYFTDSDGTSISDVIAMDAQLNTLGDELNFEVNVPLESFDSTFTGTLYYDVSWDGAKCQDASPIVDSVTFDLIDSDNNILSDFNYSGECIDDQNILHDIPTGNYDIRINGLDASGIPVYCGVFPINLGAKLNPSVKFNVSSDATECD